MKIDYIKNQIKVAGMVIACTSLFSCNSEIEDGTTDIDSWPLPRIEVTYPTEFAGLSLVSLAKIAGEESEYEKAFRFLDAAQELETLFEESRLGGVNVMVSQMKLGILVKQGKKDQALSELKHLVMGYLNIVQGRKTETPIYFDKLEWNESTSPKRGYLLENLLWLLETEDVYAELRAEDVYREMVEKIQKELEKSR